MERRLSTAPGPGKVGVAVATSVELVAGQFACKALSQSTFSAHHHLSHPNTIHAKPHLVTGICNVS
jgi:hypothetical protein